MCECVCVCLSVRLVHAQGAVPARVRLPAGRRRQPRRRHPTADVLPKTLTAKRRRMPANAAASTHHFRPASAVSSCARTLARTPPKSARRVRASAQAARSYRAWVNAPRSGRGYGDGAEHAEHRVWYEDTNTAERSTGRSTRTSILPLGGRALPRLLAPPRLALRPQLLESRLQLRRHGA